jgi:hypothetical protein
MALVIMQTDVVGVEVVGYEVGADKSYVSRLGAERGRWQLEEVGIGIEGPWRKSWAGRLRSSLDFDLEHTV